MLFAGLTLKEDKYIEFATQQRIKMYPIFLDPEYGVLHQSRGFCEDKEAFPEDHWSRGNGLHGLLDRCLDKEFATYKSCPGCLCPAVGDEKGTIRAYVEGKQPEKDEEHSYGSLMLAFYEACKNGIEDLPAPQNESL